MKVRLLHSLCLSLPSPGRAGGQNHSWGQHFSRVCDSNLGFILGQLVAAVHHSSGEKGWRAGQGGSCSPCPQSGSRQMLVLISGTLTGMMVSPTLGYVCPSHTMKDHPSKLAGLLPQVCLPGDSKVYLCHARPSCALSPRSR